jgi:hypothetical protein
MPAMVVLVGVPVLCHERVLLQREACAGSRACRSGRGRGGGSDVARPGAEGHRCGDLGLYREALGERVEQNRRRTSPSVIVDPGLLLQGDRLERGARSCARLSSSSVISPRSAPANASFRCGRSRLPRPRPGRSGVSSRRSPLLSWCPPHAWGGRHSSRRGSSRPPLAATYRSCASWVAAEAAVVVGQAVQHRAHRGRELLHAPHAAEAPLRYPSSAVIPSPRYQRQVLGQDASRRERRGSVPSRPSRERCGRRRLRVESPVLHGLHHEAPHQGDTFLQGPSRSVTVVVAKADLEPSRTPSGHAATSSSGRTRRYRRLMSGDRVRAKPRSCGCSQPSVDGATAARMPSHANDTVLVDGQQPGSRRVSVP